MLPIHLVVFDFDDTLCFGLDGGYISGGDEPPTDAFTFALDGPDTLHRSDGKRFRLFPETRPLLDELHRRQVAVSLASYNHPRSTFAALNAWHLTGYLRHPVVEWSGNKARMLERIIAALQAEGLPAAPHTTLFIDDDGAGRYRHQMAVIGVNFLQIGVDIHQLNELLDRFDVRSFPKP